MSATSNHHLEVVRNLQFFFCYTPGMDRVCIFIDGSNFYHAVKSAGVDSKIDFAKLATVLTGPDRQHVHTYYYNTPLIRSRYKEYSVRACILSLDVVVATIKW